LGHSENVYFLIDRMDDFTSHLSAIYEMEMFYGEETLRGLLEHSKNLKGDIDFFKGEYVLETEEEELTISEEGEDEKEDFEEAAAAPQGEQQ